MGCMLLLNVKVVGSWINDISLFSVALSYFGFIYSCVAVIFRAYGLFSSTVPNIINTDVRPYVQCPAVSTQFAAIIEPPHSKSSIGSFFKITCQGNWPSDAGLPDTMRFCCWHKNYKQKILYDTNVYD